MAWSIGEPRSPPPPACDTSVLQVPNAGDFNGVVDHCVRFFLLFFLFVPLGFFSIKDE